MALSEYTEEDRIEVMADGTIQVRTATVIERDGIEISRSYHRHVIQPDEDATSQSPKVQTIATATWTAEVKEAFAAAKAARELP